MKYNKINMDLRTTNEQSLHLKTVIDKEAPLSLNAILNIRRSPNVYYASLQL